MARAMSSRSYSQFIACRLKCLFSIGSSRLQGSLSSSRMEIRLPEHIFPGKVEHTLVTPELAGSFNELIRYVSTLISEPASLVLLGICLWIVATGMRRRESTLATVDGTKVIPLETARLERRLATLAFIEKSPVSTLPLKLSSDGHEDLAVNGQRRRRVMDR